MAEIPKPGPEQAGKQSGQGGMTPEHFEALMKGNALPLPGVKPLTPGGRLRGLPITPPEPVQREDPAKLLQQLIGEGFSDGEARLLILTRQDRLAGEVGDSQKFLNGLRAVKWAVDNGRMGEDMLRKEEDAD